MRRFTAMTIGLLAGIFATSTAPSLEAAEVLSWQLRNGVQYSGPGPSEQDVNTLTDVNNPFQASLSSSLNDGLDIADSQFDYRWLPEMATGQFNTSLTHSLRSVGIREVSRSDIVVAPAQDVLLRYEGSLTYFHTPGDETRIDFVFNLRDQSASHDLFTDRRQGGNALSLPSSGTLTLSGEWLLIAGTTYRIRHVLDTSNTADISEPPTGITDCVGYMNFSFVPVPEPATLSLLLTGLLIAPRRKRHRIRFNSPAFPPA